jgi:hypothetical protein
MKRISQIEKVILNRRGDSHFTPKQTGVLCCPDNHDLGEKSVAIRRGWQAK